jgi:thiamine-phosphate pyrophosphorylase
MMLAGRLRLVVVTDPEVSPGRTLLEVVAAALAGGATAIQLRDKRASARESAALCRQLRDLTRAHEALLFVNDRVDVALVGGADGAHFGDDDLPLEAARRLSPPGFLLGASAATRDEVAAAIAAGADYVGAGPVFATASKPDAGEAIGVGRIADLVSASSIPIVGIGGITESNARQVVEAGAAGVAVIAAVMRAADPEEAARRLRLELG